MKKLLLSIAISGFTALNLAAQESAEAVNIIVEEEITIENENSENGGLLSDFLLYVIKQQTPENNVRGYVTLGVFAQSGLSVGGIRNSSATMRGTSESTQFGFGTGLYLKRHAFLVTYGWSISNFRINNGLKNSILDDYSQFPLEIMPDLSVSSSTSEVFNRTSMELMLAYRYNLNKNRHSPFVELGTYRTFGVNSRYSARFVGTDDIDIDLSITKPEVFNRFDAGIQAAIGWKYVSLYTRYSLTDPLKNFDASLPRLTIGARVTFF
jgi:hypothetical protein